MTTPNQKVFSKKFNCSLNACSTKNPKTPEKQQTQHTKTHGNSDTRANINFHLPVPIWIRFLTWLCQEGNKKNCPTPPSNRNYTSNCPQRWRIILAPKNYFLAWNYISRDCRALLHGDKPGKHSGQGSTHWWGHRIFPGPAEHLAARHKRNSTVNNPEFGTNYLSMPRGHSIWTVLYQYAHWSH